MFAIGLAGLTLVMLSAPGVAAAQLSETPILFQTTRDGTSDIYAMDPDGRRQTPVIAQGSDDEDPDWAPDATRFAFTSDRTGSWQIFVMPVGGDPTPLTDEPGANVDPQWSPRGDQIAFETSRDDNWDIYVMGADGSAPMNVSKSPRPDFDPSWSADGTDIAFTRVTGRRRADIFVADLSTGETTRLTKTRAPEENPAFSPDDRRIAFDRLVGRNYDVFTMGKTGGRERRLTRSRARDRDPTWSPDSRRILFASGAIDNNLEIHAIRATGGKSRNLTRSHRGDDVEADWASTAPPRLLASPPLARLASHGPGFSCAIEPTASSPMSDGFKVVGGDNGKNRICGGPGRNWLRGFDAADKMAAGRGQDRLEGGGAADDFLSDDGEVDGLWGGQVFASSDDSGADQAWSDKIDTFHGVNSVNKVNP